MPSQSEFMESLHAIFNMKPDGLFLDQPVNEDALERVWRIFHNLTAQTHLPYPFMYLTPQAELYAIWDLSNIGEVSYRVAATFDFIKDEINVDVILFNTNEKVFNTNLVLNDSEMPNKLATLLLRYN